MVDSIESDPLRAIVPGMAALTQHEIPAGLLVSPVKGHVLIERDPAPQGPAGSLLRADQLLGKRCDTGAHVLIDPSRALAFRHVEFGPVGKTTRSGEYLLVPEAAILATVEAEPAKAPAPPPAARKRREAPPVETVDQNAARERAEAAAKEALAEAAERSDS